MYFSALLSFVVLLYLHHEFYRIPDYARPQPATLSSHSNMLDEDDVRKTEPTEAELAAPWASRWARPWDHYHHSTKPLWSVAGIDDAKPLVDAIFDDSMDFKSLINRDEWRDKLKEQRYTIHSERRPSKDENDFREALFLPTSILERLVTISAINGRALALEILLDYALDDEVDIFCILNRPAVDASLQVSNFQVFEVICSKYPIIMTFEVQSFYMPLRLAIERSNTQAVTTLKELGAEPGKGEIWSACQLESCEMLQLLLTIGPSIEDINDLRALHFVAQDGKLDHIQLLVQYGANIDLGNPLPPDNVIRHPPKIGWTPMHFAAENEHVEAMRLLESLGARTDIKARTNIMNEDEFTPAEILERKQKGLQVSDAGSMCDKVSKPYFW